LMIHGFYVNAFRKGQRLESTVCPRR
jgi:hypothetical protein